jgi:hypothetical protein
MRMKVRQFFMICVGGPLVCVPICAIGTPYVDPSYTVIQGALLSWITVPVFMALALYSAWTTALSKEERAGSRQKCYAGMLRYVSGAWFISLGYVAACHVSGHFGVVGKVCFAWLFIGGFVCCALSAKLDLIKIQLQKDRSRSEPEGSMW